MTNLNTLLSSNPYLIADSSIGSQLHSYLRLARPDDLGFEMIRPNLTSNYHNEIIEAGARLILTNTFDANRFRLSALGMADKCESLNSNAANLIRRAVKAYEDQVCVVGCIGPSGMKVSHAEAVNGFAEQAAALKNGGVEALWLESFPAVEDVEAAMIGCELAAPDLPIIVSVAFRPNYSPFTISPSVAANKIKRLKPIAFGADSGSGDMNVISTLNQMKRNLDGHTMVSKGDVDTLTLQSTIHMDSVHLMGQFARASALAGAKIIGACRSSGPAHIAAMEKELTKLPSHIYTK